MRFVVRMVALMLLAGSLSAGLASPAVAADKDRSDFATQREAQIFFLKAGGPHSDPHRLDYDGDGIVCETLPCACYYGSTVPGGAKDKKPRTVRQAGRIVSVSDGDTVRVRLAGSGKVRSVRMIGIDTPEVHGTTECWGPQASSWLKGALPKGTRVRLVSDPTQDKKDRYGRLLRYVVRTKDGRDMNRAQVWRGNASVYVYGGARFKRTSSYKRAQSQAKQAGRGLWGGC